MPAFTTITVNDRESTPVAHAFGVSDKQDARLLLTEKKSVPIGNFTLSLGWRKSGGRFHRKVMLTMPEVVTETINGVSVPSVLHTSLLDMTLRFDEKSSEQHRKNAVGMFYNLLASGQTDMMKLLIDLEAGW